MVNGCARSTYSNGSGDGSAVSTGSPPAVIDDTAPDAIPSIIHELAELRGSDYAEVPLHSHAVLLLLCLRIHVLAGDSGGSADADCAARTLSGAEAGWH